MLAQVNTTYKGLVIMKHTFLSYLFILVFNFFISRIVSNWKSMKSFLFIIYYNRKMKNHAPPSKETLWLFYIHFLWTIPAVASASILSRLPTTLCPLNEGPMRNEQLHSRRLTVRAIQALKLKSQRNGQRWVCIAEFVYQILLFDIFLFENKRQVKIK